MSALSEGESVTDQLAAPAAGMRAASLSSSESAPDAGMRPMRCVHHYVRANGGVRCWKCGTVLRGKIVGVD